MAGAESGTRGGRGRGQVAGQVRSQDTVLRMMIMMECRSPGPGSPAPSWTGRVSPSWPDTRVDTVWAGGGGAWRGRSPGLGDVTATHETWV